MQDVYVGLSSKSVLNSSGGVLFLRNHSRQCVLDLAQCDRPVVRILCTVLEYKAKRLASQCQQSTWAHSHGLLNAEESLCDVSDRYTYYFWTSENLQRMHTIESTADECPSAKEAKQHKRRHVGEGSHDLVAQLHCRIPSVQNLDGRLADRAFDILSLYLEIGHPCEHTLLMSFQRARTGCHPACRYVRWGFVLEAYEAPMHVIQDILRWRWRRGWFHVRGLAIIWSLGRGCCVITRYGVALDRRCGSSVVECCRVAWGVGDWRRWRGGHDVANRTRQGRAITADWWVCEHKAIAGCEISKSNESVPLREYVFLKLTARASGWLEIQGDIISK